jgi:predicted membrane protein
MGNSRHSPTAISGIIAIVIGGLFLLDHSGVIHIGSLWRFWPLILIFIGLRGLIWPETGCRHGGSARGVTIGSGITLIWGLLLLGATFGYLPWTSLWAWFLILLGLLLVWEAYRPRPESPPVSMGSLRPESIFSSIQKMVTDQNFTSGSASAIFGSVELDFLQANIAGDSAVVELNAVFGSIEVRVPMNWIISIEAGAVFGACENKTRGPLPNAGPVKTLIVRGGAVFGSIEIKN